jgi:hypothetical protein
MSLDNDPYDKKEQYLLLISPPFSACQIETKMVRKTQTQDTGHNNNIQGGSNMTRTDFFFLKTIIAKHLLAHVSLQRTPLRSQHIFSNVLEAS